SFAMRPNTPKPTVLPPEISERTPSKDRIRKLEREREIREYDFIKARKGIRPSHPFDLSYWHTAATASGCGVQLYEVELELAIAKFQDRFVGAAPISFWSTREAHVILDKLQAATLEKRLYQEQAIKVEKGGTVRQAIVAMFN